MTEENGKRPSRRPLRMADLIREEIAGYLIKGNKDPRIGFVTITQVTMTPDLQNARVCYSAYGSEAEKKESGLGLKESAGKIRAHLARVCRVQFIPRIEFFVDEGLEKSYRVQELLGKITYEDPVEESDDPRNEEDDED
jgi:ribosome-binding factor A